MNSATPIISEQIEALPFFLTRMAVDHTEKGCYREHGFDEYHIMQCIKGIGEFICQENTYQINEFDIVLFAPAIPHNYFMSAKSPEPWTLNWLCFCENGAHKITTQLFEQGHCVIRAADAPDLSAQFEEVATVLQDDSIYHQMQASAILYRIIIDLVAKKRRYVNTNEPSLLPVISYMQQHLKETVTIHDLSHIARVSVSYLCRAFKRTYQMPPIQYLIHLRMMHARNLLTMQRQSTVKLVAAECGYTDLAYFCSEFKRHFRLTPSEYQKQFSE